MSLLSQVVLIIEPGEDRKTIEAILGYRQAGWGRLSNTTDDFTVDEIFVGCFNFFDAERLTAFVKEHASAEARERGLLLYASSNDNEWTTVQLSEAE